MEIDENNLLQDLDILYEKLNADVLLLEKLTDKENSDLWRRSYCRAIFALIEAIAAWMKRFTVHCYYPGMLSEDDKKELERRSGALQGFFAALDLFANTSGTETPFKKDSEEWIKLQNTIKIRNRITHPKSPVEIEITDDDLRQLHATKEMFVALVSACLRDSALSLLRQADALQRAWDNSRANVSMPHKEID